MNSTIFLYLVQDGVANGAIYALLGLAIVLVFLVTRVIFIAQGEFVSFAALTFTFLHEGHVPGTIGLLGALIVIASAVEIGWGVWRGEVAARLKDLPRLVGAPILVLLLAWGSAMLSLPLIVHALVAVAVVSAMAPLIYRLVYEPVAEASVLLLLIVSVALHLVLVGLGLYFFGPAGARSAPFFDTTFVMFGVPVPGQTLVILATTLVVMVSLYLAANLSFWGKAMLAAAASRTGARLMGISATFVGRTAFTLAALIGAISGVLFSSATTIYYDTGFMIGLKGFVGAVLAGLGSFPLAALGALAVGLIESFSSFFASAFKDVIVFGLVLPILLVRSLVTSELDEEDHPAAAAVPPAATRRQILLRRCGAVALLVVVAGAPFVLSEYHVALLDHVGLAALVVLGLVLLTGVAGLTSFGQAAYVGIGAYITGYLTATLGLSPWLALPVVVVLAVAASLIAAVATVKLSGHYLALATLSIGVAAYYLMGSLQITGGQSGMTDIPPLSLFGWPIAGPLPFYPVIWGTALVAFLALRNLLDSRQGRAIRALRQGTALVECLGVDALRARAGSFVIACLLAALSGWLYAHFQRFLNPSPFSINESIEYLFMAVVGGIGSIGGAFLGSGLVVLVKQLLQESLPRLLGATGDFEVIVFGIATILLLQWAPDGLWPRLVAGFGSLAPPLPDLRAKALATRDKPAPGTVLLQIDHVGRRFGGIQAVDDVSITVSAGEIVALIGPNGAGKSTLFNLVSGVLQPSAGTIAFLGRRGGRRAARDFARRGLARTFQHVKILGDTSTIENVALGAHERGRAGLLAACCRADRGEEAQLIAEAQRQLTRVGLGDASALPAGTLALGQQRLVEIARALASDPCLLLLDEPAAGLRYGEKQALAALIRELKSTGVTVLLVEHDMDFVMGLADRIVVMKSGRKLTEGVPEAIRQAPDVVAAYLGEAA